MNKKIATLILGPAELNGLLREYPEKLWNNECIALTPDVFELTFTNKKFKNIIYPEWVQEIKTFSEENYKNIEKELIEIETKSYFERKRIFNDEKELVDWNYQSNFFLFYMSMAAKEFAKKSYKSLIKYEKIEIISLAHAGEFYFDSCLQPLILNNELLNLGVNTQITVLDDRAQALTYQSQLYENIPNIFSDEFRIQWKNKKLSILIATSAIYNKLDQQKLVQIINSNHFGEGHIIYPLPLWSVLKESEIFNNKINIYEALELLTKNERTKCIEYAGWLTEITREILIKYFNSNNLENNILFESQIRRIHKRHILQTLTYIAWKNVFKLRKINMLAITIQDSSISGPLASASTIFGTEILTVPHSRIVNWRTICKSIVATEWWQPQESLSLWGEPNNSLFFNQVEQKKNNVFDINLNWIIIYNGVQENIANTVAWPFVKKVVNFLEDYTKKAKIRLRHRLKPGDQTPINTYSKILNINKDNLLDDLKVPLEEILNRADLVISIDEPSSALWQALSQGCAVILVTDRELMKESIIDDHTLKPINFEIFRDKITSFIDEPISLLEYKQDQQNKYQELFEKRTKNNSNISGEN
jgi:hypothetical protein